MRKRFDQYAKGMRTRATIMLAGGFVLLGIYHSFALFDNSYQRRERVFEIKYDFSVDQIPNGAEQIKVWVPIPLDSDHQRLEGFSLQQRLDYIVAFEHEYGNRFLIFDLSDMVANGQDSVSLSLNYLIRRYSVDVLDTQLKTLKPVEARLGRYLLPDTLIPIDGDIAKEAKRTAGGITSQLQQARLIYDNIVSTMTYDKTGVGWGRGDALYACDVRKGNCTDFHSLFIGQSRALGIPARFIMGLPVPPDKNSGQIPGYHCWGEFYIEGSGWVPIDASEASKHPEKREMFFGGLDENRVAFSIGRDIKLPDSVSRPLNYSIYPHVEINGAVHDKVTTNFSFKELAAE